MSEEVSRAETLEGDIEAPVEPNYREDAAYAEKLTEDSAEEALDEIKEEETAYTVEVSGSAAE